MLAGKPVHFLIPGARKPNRWTRPAKTLLEAFQVYKDSLCGSCGHSGIHSMDIANSREFVADKAVCLGCQVREIYRDQHEDMLKTAKGLKIYAVSKMGPVYEDDES